MTNEEKYNKYKREQIYRYLIILLSFSVILLEAFALFNIISYLWGLIPFVLSCVVKYLKQREIDNKNKK